MISVWVMNFCRHRSIRFCTLLMSFQETLESSSALPAPPAEEAAAGPPSPLAPPALLLLVFSFAAAAGACGCGAATGAATACDIAPGSCTGATSMAVLNSRTPRARLRVMLVRSLSVAHKQLFLRPHTDTARQKMLPLRLSLSVPRSSGLRMVWGQDLTHLAHPSIAKIPSVFFLL